MTPNASISTQPLVMRTVRETALLLAISQTSAYALIRGGKLPHYRIGGAIRVAQADIEAFLACCRRDRQPVERRRQLRPRLKHIKL